MSHSSGIKKEPLTDGEIHVLVSIEILGNYAGIDLISRLTDKTNQRTRNVLFQLGSKGLVEKWDNFDHVMNFYMNNNKGKVKKKIKIEEHPEGASGPRKSWKLKDNFTNIVKNHVEIEEWANKFGINGRDELVKQIEKIAENRQEIISNMDNISAIVSFSKQIKNKK